MGGLIIYIFEWAWRLIFCLYGHILVLIFFPSKSWWDLSPTVFYIGSAPVISDDQLKIHTLALAFCRGGSNEEEGGTQVPPRFWRKKN